MMHTTSFHRTVLSLVFLWLCSNSASAQIMQKFGDNSTSIDKNAVLELESKNKGFLLPRMTKVQRDAIVGPPEGLMIWCTDCSLTNGPEVAVWLSDSWTGLLVSNLAENNVLKGNSEGKATAVPFLSNGIKYGSTDTSEMISTSSTSDALMPGMTKSPEAGTYLVFFNGQYSISPASSTNVVSTAQGIEDLTTIYNEINSLPVTDYVAAAADLGGQIVTPGVYSWGGALVINSDVTLDAKNDPNAYFVFKTEGAFNTGAGVKIKLVNGASASNIYWVSTGAIGIGAGCTVKGTLLSKLAVAVGADCIVEGRLLTTAGAIGFGPGTITVPSGASFINFRTVSSFVALTASGAIANTGISTYNGDIATGLGAVTGFETAIVNGTIFPAAGDTVVVKEIDGNATFSLYQNGVQIPNSSRVRTTKLNTVDVSLQAIATVAQGQTIDVRWNIDAGTLSVKNRILTVIKVQ
jgi:hypothetical protein